jgi:CBS-domain-containing membrane protein
LYQNVEATVRTKEAAMIAFHQQPEFRKASFDGTCPSIRAVPAVSVSASAETIASMFLQDNVRDVVFVVDADRHLLGQISPGNLSNVLFDTLALTARGLKLEMSAICALDLLVAVEDVLQLDSAPDDVVEAVVRSAAEELPVVDGSRRLVGSVSKLAVLRYLMPQGNRPERSPVAPNERRWPVSDDL